MKPTTHKYANAYADGGKAKKKPMKKPEKGGKPKRITTKNSPGGPYTPGAKAGGMADGGKAKKKKAEKPDPAVLGTGGAAKAGKAISARQRRIDKALADAGA